MVVATVTRRQVVDMFPEYLTKRGAVLASAIDAYAVELALEVDPRFRRPRDALLILLNGWLIRDGDRVTRERYVVRSPYPRKRPGLEQTWGELVRAGLATADGDGWRLTPRGMEVVPELARRRRAALRSFEAPREATSRAAASLARIAGAIPADAVRASWPRQLRPHPTEPRSDLVALDQAIYELWFFRDDCHIGAWASHGYDGPEFDILSYVWQGPADVSWTKLPAASSLDALAKAIESKQDRADVERSVDALVRRGDVGRSGDAISLTEQGGRSRDAIEVETDRRYFAIWDLDDAATSRLGEDLRAVIDALPKA